MLPLLYFVLEKHQKRWHQTVTGHWYYDWKTDDDNGL
jgi:hypothetical protein